MIRPNSRPATGTGLANLAHHFARRLALGLVLLAPAACDSALLKDTTSEIDSLAQTITAPGPAPRIGRASAADLLRNAERRGPEFLAARISAAESRLRLDQRKSTLWPGASLGARRLLSSELGGGRASGAEDIFVSVDWDITDAILLASSDELDLASDLIATQEQLARSKATLSLLTALLDYEERLIETDGIRNQKQLATCRLDSAETELALGNLSEAEVRASRAALASFAERIAAARDVEDSAHRRVTSLAGLPDGVALRTGADPAALLPAVAAGISPAACYRDSGNALRDSLLLAAASSTIRAARLERLGTFDVLLPSQISAASGLNLSALVTLLVPVVDRGAGQRRVQKARLNLLSIALSAEENRRRFGAALAAISSLRAEAQGIASQARAELTRQSTAPDLAPDTGTQTERAQRCTGTTRQSKAALDLRRAEISQRRARLQLAVLCHPAPPTTRDQDALRRQARAGVAPRT